MVQSSWRTIWRSLKKLKIQLPDHLAVSSVGIYSDKRIIRKDTGTPVSTATLCTTARVGKQPKRPSAEGWTKKMQYVYTVACWSQKRMKQCHLQQHRRDQR